MIKTFPKIDFLFHYKYGDLIDHPITLDITKMTTRARVFGQTRVTSYLIA